jgi:hypothetical protein
MIWLYLIGTIAIVATFVADLWVHIDYRIAANVSLVYMALFVTVFTLLYAIRSNWRVNRIGKVFLAKGIAFSAVLWQIVIALWIDTEYPHRQELRFAIYSLGALAYLAMVVVLVIEQRNDRRERERLE